MAWIIGLLMALIGAAVASGSSILLGLLGGFLLGHGWIRRKRLADQIERLQRQVDALHRGPVQAGLLPVATSTPPEVTTPPALDPLAAREAHAPTPPVFTENTQGKAGAPEMAAAGAPAPSEATAQTGTIARITSVLGHFMFEGNLPAKIGLLVSLFGVAALVKLGATQGWLVLPVSWRLAAIAMAGMGLLAYGIAQARLRPAFGLSLQGGGIAILLLTTFGAYRIWQLLPATLAFGLVTGLVVGTAILAIRQHAVWLAVLGFLGGYLAPILLSSGSGNHVALFSWYAVLNLAVFAMAWVRPWRALHLIGFFFTFGTGAIWGMRYFQPNLFWSVEPFLVGFFLLYVTIPLLYARRGDNPGKVDATLLFGTPLIAFPMQVGLFDGERLPLALSALAVGAIYAALARMANKDNRLRDFAQGAAALGIAFATLAVPLALSARWTSTAWALQGIVLVWLGLRQHRTWPLAGGIALQYLAALAYVAGFSTIGDARAILNGHSLNVLVLTASALACAGFLMRSDQRVHRGLSHVMTAIGMGWWAWGVARELVANIAPSDALVGGAMLFSIAVTLGIGAFVQGRTGLLALRWQTAAWCLLTPIAALLAHLEDEAWLASPWALAFPALWFAAIRALPSVLPSRHRAGMAHAALLGGTLLAAGLGLQQGLEAVSPSLILGDNWHAVLPWLPLALWTAGFVHKPTTASWPMAEHAPTYRAWLLWPAGLLLMSVWLGTQGERGDAHPLPWLPLLNPLELFHLGGIVGMAWLARRSKAKGKLLWSACGFMAFCLLTMATLRLAHDWFDQPWLPTLWYTAFAQAALSIVWATAGVMAWIVGSRRRQWGVWLAGAILLGVVLLKLVAVDRGSLGDIEGIAAFLGVGGLLLLVGRIAPMPPRAADSSGE